MGERRRTSTSNFGVGRRESHDAAGFYSRFRPPVLDADDAVAAPAPVAKAFVEGDARVMDGIADGSVALVATSPPYFAGKAYEEELEREGVPGSYLEYLSMLRDVFAECVRKLEPGGRIAVNVANLGRKPYRSLSSDVISILQDDLGLLLRGELIWQKGEGASGSCAWGSFRSAANPVLRDLTERVVVASKGRFDRARGVKQRRQEGLPAESTMTADDFMSMTLDVWSLPPASAKRVGHPAPFPVELPEQLIRLYTYAGDLVLDPFMGSGSTLVAAALLGRRYAGYDLDPGYVDLAKRRVKEALAAAAAVAPPAPTPTEPAPKLAEAALIDAGFGIAGRARRLAGAGITVPFACRTAQGGCDWYFDLAGPHTTRRGGLLRSEVVWRSIGRAAAARGVLGDGSPYVLLTTALPPTGTEADRALRSAGPGILFDVVDILSPGDVERLGRYSRSAGGRPVPLPGFWTEEDLAARLAR